MAKNYWEENKVSGTELMAMRMMRGKAHGDMLKYSRSKKYKGILLNRITYKDLERFEREFKECPIDLVEFYMKVLGITNSHMAQFKKILKGQLDTFQEDRTIAQSVKKEVRAKYKNKCAHCGSKENLQLHHKEHFSKGGQNTVDNLILLCVTCHAEQHKGETAYNLILSKANKE